MDINNLYSRYNNRLSFGTIKGKRGEQMTRGTMCDVCEKFFKDKRYNIINPELTSHKMNNRSKVNHICMKCVREKLGLK